MLYQDLSAPFPPEMERELRKGGTSLVYIPVSEVITRLNKVIGVDSWSMRIISCERDKIDSDFIVAHVSLDAVIKDEKGDTRVVHRDGIGGQKIKRTKQGDIVDLGDEMKGAVSDALKKAAQTLGIGLYLARSEDAMEIEEVIAASQAPVSAGEAERLELWDNFVGLAKSLNAEQKEQLNTHWKQYSGGRAKPTKASASVDELTELIAACVKVSFGAMEQSDE